MNIKAIIPAGLTEITVHGLHQWDYGRKLEIHSPDLPAIIEVHFACAGMTEAVVRSCSVTNGVATAAIPDRCLEQTTPITAWVYELDGASGVTTAKINLVIEPRIRPCPSQEIPEDIADKYTEAVGAMNAAVNSVATGNVTVARAIADGNGNNIPNTYAPQADVYGTVLYTDLLAKVKELVAMRTARSYLFKLGGSGYETDDNGNPVNLPSVRYTYSFVTIYTYYDAARVYLWGCTWDTTPLCYGFYQDVDGGKWSGWQEVIDSKNIGTHTSHLANRADMVYSMKRTLSNVQLNTEYAIGTMPDDLWGDGGNYIDPNESVLQVVVRPHSADIEMTASSGTNATKQNYQLHGLQWDTSNLVEADCKRYVAIATLWRMGSQVRFKISSYCIIKDDGAYQFIGTAGANLGDMTVRVDFHRAITN